MFTKLTRTFLATMIQDLSTLCLKYEEEQTFILLNEVGKAIANNNEKTLNDCIQDHIDLPAILATEPTHDEMDAIIKERLMARDLHQKEDLVQSH